MCLLASYYRCFFDIPISTVKPQTVDAASVTPQDPDHQTDISFDTKVCRSPAAVSKDHSKCFHISRGA